MKPEDNKPVKPVRKVSSLKWKRLFAKKWFFPAVYLATAALILSLVWWYQGAQNSGVNKTNTSWEDSFKQEEPTIGKSEHMKSPTKEISKTVESMGYYDEAASEKSKEAALVKYSNTYWPHPGLDYARKDGKSFDVLAAMGGKVLLVEENPLTGHQVEIRHNDGVVTIYQSLADVSVKKGDTVSQGDTIAKAGRNNFEKEAGIHLHFEVRKDGESVNPAQYLGKQ
ncbi:M23 family metallopeptidase [Marininema halotolerans]|uniref:Stage II sporulation protein Q n=1 Tax=Marininema halotolerans TaxID=1155944 RepID=A0A1I6P1J5_9BACL|nr:M23 family metallopeptidase [Marininema halotolerans]SFS34086.1 stage II sporulation protein Q [Marininema halotolerans]